MADVYAAFANYSRLEATRLEYIAEWIVYSPDWSQDGKRQATAIGPGGFGVGAAGDRKPIIGI